MRSFWGRLMGGVGHRAELPTFVRMAPGHIEMRDSRGRVHATYRKGTGWILPNGFILERGSASLRAHREAFARAKREGRYHAAEGHAAQAWFPIKSHPVNRSVVLRAKHRDAGPYTIGTRFEDWVVVGPRTIGIEMPGHWGQRMSFEIASAAFEALSLDEEPTRTDAQQAVAVARQWHPTNGHRYRRDGHYTKHVIENYQQRQAGLRRQVAGKGVTRWVPAGGRAEEPLHVTITRRPLRKRFGMGWLYELEASRPVHAWNPRRGGSTRSSADNLDQARSIARRAAGSNVTEAWEGGRRQRGRLAAGRSKDVEAAVLAAQHLTGYRRSAGPRGRPQDERKLQRKLDTKIRALARRYGIPEHDAQAQILHEASRRGPITPLPGRDY